MALWAVMVLLADQDTSKGLLPNFQQKSQNQPKIISQARKESNNDDLIDSVLKWHCISVSLH